MDVYMDPLYILNIKDFCQIPINGIYLVKNIPPMFDPCFMIYAKKISDFPYPYVPRYEDNEDGNSVCDCCMAIMERIQKDCYFNTRYRYLVKPTCCYVYENFYI